MKKLISLLLVLTMVLSLGVAAFAADGDEPAAAGATHDPITVPKVYDVSGGDGETIPAETLTFSVDPDDSNPDSAAITVAPIDTADTTDITIAFPTYTKMGVYTYLVSEDEGETLAVDYDTADIKVIVTVVNEKAGDGNEDALKVYVAVYKLTENGEVKDKIAGDDEEEITDPDGAAFTNKYGLGNLTVSKEVTGNLASNTKEFTIHVNFAGGTNAGNDITYSVAGGDSTTLAFNEEGKASADITLKHGDSAEFTNIPAGVTYTVEEDSKHTEGEINSDEGYTATYESEEENGAGKIDAEDEDTVTITNDKSTEVQTGITLDTLPYVMIVLAALAAAAVIVIRKRRIAE